MKGNCAVERRRMQGGDIKRRRKRWRKLRAKWRNFMIIGGCPFMAPTFFFEKFLIPTRQSTLPRTKRCKDMQETWREPRQTSHEWTLPFGRYGCNFVFYMCGVYCRIPCMSTCGSFLPYQYELKSWGVYFTYKRAFLKVLMPNSSSFYPHSCCDN